MHGGTSLAIRRRQVSPYGAVQPSTTPESMHRIAPDQFSPLTPGATSSAFEMTPKSPVGSSVTPSPSGSLWPQGPTSPFLANPEGYRYQDIDGDDLEERTLPKYHFSLSWTNRGVQGAPSTLAPSGPQQIDDVLFRLKVDRNGLRCACLALRKYNGLPLPVCYSPGLHRDRLDS
jgi:hypothetical protein